MSAPSVPFKRLLIPADDQGGPTRGDDVLAVKIAVSRMGFWPWQEFDPVMNAQFAHGIGARKSSYGLAGFQRLAQVNPDGRYGSLTHAKLIAAKVPKGLPHAGEYAFDGHALALYAGVDVPTHREAIVNDIFRWWQWLVDRTAQVGYRQYRPMRELQLRHEPPRLPFDADCSSTFIYAAFLGGALSPDLTYGFSGYGNTDSLVRCGVPITEAQIPVYAREHYIGAFYGASRWQTHHIVAVKSPTLIYSHGRPEAPEVHTTVHYRSDFLECRAFAVA